MDKLDINNSLNRVQNADNIKAILNDFEANKTISFSRRGFMYTEIRGQGKRHLLRIY